MSHFTHEYHIFNSINYNTAEFFRNITTKIHSWMHFKQIVDYFMFKIVPRLLK
jgi:hypothetical protein